MAKSKYLFCKPVEELNVPLLMIGSREDEMCRDDMENEYAELSSLIKNVKIEMFDSGIHPLILSKANEIAKLIKKYCIALTPKS